MHCTAISHVEGVSARLGWTVAGMRSPNDQNNLRKRVFETGYSKQNQDSIRGSRHLRNSILQKRASSSDGMRRGGLTVLEILNGNERVPSARAERLQVGELQREETNMPRISQSPVLVHQRYTWERATCGRMKLGVGLSSLCGQPVPVIPRRFLLHCCRPRPARCLSWATRYRSSVTSTWCVP